MNNQDINSIFETVVFVLRHLFPFLPIIIFPSVFRLIKSMLTEYSFVSKKEKNVIRDETFKSEIKPYIDDMSITATVDNLINADRQDLLEWYYEHMYEME